jgi:hypothetical protein
LSTLTKILITLLTVFSFFLCGIVIVYVSNAENYMQKYKDSERAKSSLNEKLSSATKQLNEKIAEMGRMEDKYKAEIASAKVESDKLLAELTDVKRQKSDLEQKVNNWASITKDFSETNNKQRELFEKTFAELNKTKAELIKEHKELNDVTTSMMEKMAIIETLSAEKKRLVEEKTDLQNQLDKYLMPRGQKAAATPVTPEISNAKPQEPSVSEGKEIALKGKVTKVDINNHLASISLGSADGVKEGMKFHITRGEEFICSLLIIDVEADQSVGILELVQKEPKVGDGVATNL